VQGAGDQGMMSAFLVAETDELMLLPILWRIKLVKNLRMLENQERLIFSDLIQNPR
jgi:S-adenosylmethionine synthetase